MQLMEKIISVPKDKKFFTVQELLDLGFSYYRIHKLVEEGILIKQSKKLYDISSPQLVLSPLLYTIMQYVKSLSIHMA